MKPLKLVFFLIFTLTFQLGFGQQRTFYMDSITIERNKEKINFNRFNSPVYMASDEKSKTIFLGVVGEDSVHLHLKQGVITCKSEPVPVLLYNFIFKNLASLAIDSLQGYYVHFDPNSSTSRQTNATNLEMVFFHLIADTSTYRLIPSAILQPNTFEIIHKLKNISIGGKSFKSTHQIISTNIGNNVETEKVVIGRFKKEPITYNISVHPISSFPDVKIIYINYEFGTLSTHTHSKIMFGNQAVSEEHLYSPYYFELNNKSYLFSSTPSYLITVKN